MSRLQIALGFTASVASWMGCFDSGNESLSDASSPASADRCRDIALDDLASHRGGFEPNSNLPCFRFELPQNTTVGLNTVLSAGDVAPSSWQLYPANMTNVYTDDQKVDTLFDNNWSRPLGKGTYVLVPTSFTSGTFAFDIARGPAQANPSPAADPTNSAADRAGIVALTEGGVSEYVGHPDQADIYSFQLAADASVTLELTFSSTRMGSIDAVVYRDRHDGTVLADDSVLEVSTFGQSSSVMETDRLTAGDYLLKVSATNPFLYDLRVSSRPL